MTTFTYVTMLIALLFAGYFTVLYLRRLLQGGGFWRKTWRWLKDVVDSLMGMS